MTIPTIHLNGTSKGHLLSALCDASEHLEATCRAIKATAPNGRDYYVQGPNAFAAAQAEHMSRLCRLDEIQREIDALMVAVDAQ